MALSQTKARATFSLPKSLIERIERMAEDKRWSRSVTVEVLVSEALDRRKVRSPVKARSQDGQ